MFNTSQSGMVSAEKYRNELIEKENQKNKKKKQQKKAYILTLKQVFPYILQLI